MKNLKKYINRLGTFIAITLILTSCSLDVVPPANITPETYWKTEKDAWYNLNAIYRALSPSTGFYADAYTEDVYCQYPWESSGPIFLQNGLSPASDQGWGFSGIRKVNVFLKEVEACDMDDKLRERMKAEARFFRANDYLGKTLYFGKVPVITEPLPYNSPNIPRAPVEKVREFILEELDAISKILPESYTGGYINEKGRATKYAALALRARAALYFGEYQIAEKVAGEVIDSKLFSLFQVSTLTDKQQKEADEMQHYIDFDALGIDKDKFTKGMFSYEALWHDQNANPSNPEYIYSRQYAPVSGQQDWARYLAIRPNQLGGWSSVTPTQELVNAYWTADGKKAITMNAVDRKKTYDEIRNVYNTYKETTKKNMLDFVEDKLPTGELTKYDFIKEYRNRDSRLYASILLPFKGWYETEFGNRFAYEWVKGGNNESGTGYNFRKMTPLDKAPNGAQESTADYPAIRYAEVLLIYAEARTNTTGFDVKAQSAINEIRDRCGMPHVPTGLTKDQALDLIQNERRIELAGEGFRADDLTRYTDEYWKSHLNNVTMSAPDGTVIIVMKWDARMRLRPIPQDAIDLNPLLKDDQNPGYK